MSSAFASCDGLTVSEHIYGDPVCVPASPQRVVTLDPWLSFGMLKELGAPIVGVPMIGIQDESQRQSAKDAAIADIGHPMQPSLERIIALQPDLIIGSTYLHEQIFDKLSAIAPTLLIDNMGWKEHYALMAKIIGHEDLQRDAMLAYERRVGDIQSRMPKDLTVSVVRVGPLGFQVYLDGPAAYAPYAVLSEVGIVRTDFEKTADDRILKRLDWEEISALTGDILLYVVVSGYDPEPDDDLAAVALANPLWQSLPAVQAGRAYRIDRAPWMGFDGTASAYRVLDDIERYILTDP
ncbi:iron-siderophore ABC transporter substrate-binding protein [Roseibium sp. H3510]|uniref:Iron-siderophore ABC transporter substrate-binding protein n=2 Tax=Roseibium algae TaxID=3123038 RepID=A0ABU8TQV7_9HYPH